LRRLQRHVEGERRPPIVLAVNRCDNPQRRDQAQIFHELGMGDPFPISALHGRGTGDLLDALVQRLPHPPEEIPSAEIQEEETSALHGRGTGDLLDALVQRLPHPPEEIPSAEIQEEETAGPTWANPACSIACWARSE